MGVAGSGLLPLADGQGIGRLQFLLACAAVLLAAVLLTLRSPRGDGPFVAFVVASGAGLTSVVAAILAHWTPAETAALCAPVGVGAPAFLPGLSLRFARLPIGFDAPATAPRGAYGADPLPREPVEAERIAAQARCGHELLVGLVGGCAVITVGACAVLGFSDDVWARLLAPAAGIALLMRAHLFRYTAQVAPVLAAGLGSLVLLGLGLAPNPPHSVIRDALTGDRADLDIRTVWLVAAIAAASAIGLIGSRGGLTPFWGRFMELAEGFVLLTLVPPALAVFDVYAAARSMTGRPADGGAGRPPPPSRSGRSKWSPARGPPPVTPPSPPAPPPRHTRRCAGAAAGTSRPRARLRRGGSPVVRRAPCSGPASPPQPPMRRAPRSGRLG